VPVGDSDRADAYISAAGPSPLACRLIAEAPKGRAGRPQIANPSRLQACLRCLSLHTRFPSSSLPGVPPTRAEALLGEAYQPKLRRAKARQSNDGSPRFCQALAPPYWMPDTRPGMTSERRTHETVAAMRAHPGYAPFAPQEHEGGDAPNGANLIAPPLSPESEGAFRRASRSVFRHQAALSPRSKLPAIVSQLLAGTSSGPGRSSGAARVLGLRSQACGRRTSSRLTYASRSAPEVDEV
jgi:hypothetical protein